MNTLRPRYDVSIIHRRPNETGPPDYVDLGIVTAFGLSWSTSLAGDAAATISVNPAALKPGIKTALRSQLPVAAGDITALELWITRGDTPVFRGPILAPLVQGSAHTMTLTGRSREYYLRGMFVGPTDLVVPDAGEDQYTVARRLINQWQTQPYGHYGIDTSSSSTSGQLRHGSYLAAEGHIVYDRVTELGNREGGFDWWLDTVTGEFMLVERRGVDKRTTVMIDRRHILDPSQSWSMAAGTYANVVQSTSEDLVAVAEDTAGVESFGRWGRLTSHDSVGLQATLDAHAARELADTRLPRYQPSPEIRGIDATMIEPGDIIEVAYDAGLGMVVAHRRVHTLTVSVSPENAETLQPEFLPPDDDEV